MRKLKVIIALAGALLVVLLVVLVVNRNSVPDSIRTSQNAELIRVKAGVFMMGNTRNDSEGFSNEKPVHRVTLTYDYWIGKYEVTFAEYDAFCDETGRSKPTDRGWDWDTKEEIWVSGAHMGRGTRAVINVSWNDAIAYCNWLSQRKGLKPAYDSDGNLLDRNGRTTMDITQVEGYRLPTEAEWEYTARGGHKSEVDYKYAGSDDIDEVAWYMHNAMAIQSVGQKKANELGLYDMSGNVYEWCHDWWETKYYEKGNKTNPIGPSSGSDRVLRGGCWGSNALLCRVALRNNGTPDGRNNFLGFRLARTVIP